MFIVPFFHCPMYPISVVMFTHSSSGMHCPAWHVCPVGHCTSCGQFVQFSPVSAIPFPHSGPCTVWSVNCFVLCCCVVSVAFIVNVLVSTVVGVPFIVPLLFRFSPVGSVPVSRDHVYGLVPFCAWSV